MTENLTATPASMSAGDSIAWTISNSDYPASAGWSLSYVAINSAAKISISSAASGDSHLVSLAAATTGAYTAGDYKYSAYMTLGSDRYTVETGDIKILPNLAAKTTFDGRTYAETCLANIETVLGGRASADVLKYTIAGRQLAKYTWDDLIKARGYFRNEVNKEKRKAAGVGSKVLVRFK